MEAQILFIDADYIKAYSQVGGNVDEKFFLSAIITAQDKYIQPILGTNLYKDVQTNIANLAGENANYPALMNDYIRMATMRWALVELYPYLSNKILNSSISQVSGDNATPLAKSEVDALISLERNNAQFYSERMIDYLQANTSLFPKYGTTTDSSQMSPTNSVYYENGLTISGDSNRNWLNKINCCK
tara:strand:+ start:23314 stop:23874 length:561 start_codon:yes stop_codon:yes gene_type:complete